MSDPWQELELWEPVDMRIHPYASGELGARNEIAGYVVEVWFPRGLGPLVADDRTVTDAVREILSLRETL